MYSLYSPPAESPYSHLLQLINGGDDNILDLSKERRPVKNYTLPDFEAVSRQLWQNDWHDYYHELYRSGLHLLQLLHCGTSGRAGEFEKNLRFRVGELNPSTIQRRATLTLLSRTLRLPRSGSPASHRSCWIYGEIKRRVFKICLESSR
jgi:hypothetical protein